MPSKKSLIFRAIYKVKTPTGFRLHILVLVALIGKLKFLSAPAWVWVSTVIKNSFVHFSLSLNKIMVGGHQKKSDFRCNLLHLKMRLLAWVNRFLRVFLKSCPSLWYSILTSMMLVIIIVYVKNSAEFWLFLFWKHL